MGNEREWFRPMLVSDRNSNFPERVCVLPTRYRQWFVARQALDVRDAPVECVAIHPKSIGPLVCRQYANGAGVTLNALFMRPPFSR